jgi:serine/threonine protein kinase
MVVDPNSGGGSPNEGLMERTERISQGFELAWKQHQRPQLEAFLEGSMGAERSQLLHKLLVIELAQRRQLGESPQESEYLQRFESETKAVRDAFGTDAAMSGTGRLSGVTQISPANEVPQVPTVTAQYSNLRFHAAGGLGDVYRAQDESLRREVALKFTQQRHGGNPDYLELFLLEAEITSRLNHPGIVPVYGLGESADGRPFYAMRFIEGTQFKAAIETFHQNGAQHRELHHLLTHLVAACNTVAYAHNRGIVHRDIKPENIMLGKYGETLLVDWGLAMPVERDERARASGEKTMLFSGGGGGGGSIGSDSGRSSSGSGAGTIGYMSPEQLPDHPGTITAASDVYSLGATLYRLLTNRAPIHGHGESLLLDKVRWGDFPKPSTVKRDVPPALEAICLKAMATIPEDRYPTASDLAADLEAWLADEVVSVYHEPPSARVFRWARRHQHWVIVGTMGIAIILLALFGYSLNSRSLAAIQTRARIEAENARTMAEKARAEAEQAKQNGMRVAARFAAKAVANEIDVRWRVLTHEAESPALQKILIDVANKPVGSPEQRAAQQWIEDHRKNHSVQSESWFLTDHRGIQIARDPFSRKTIYEDYSRRTYFHGGAHELKPEEIKGPIKPISSPHLSAVYLSTTSGTLKVSFSVPIWKGDESLGECLGVLGMSLELGAFRELQTGLNAGQIAVLLDTREDQVEGQPRTGLILHHRNLYQAQQRRLAAGDESFPRISPQRVEQLVRLRKLRSREAGLIASPASEEAGAAVQGPIELAGSLDTRYIDPLAEPGSPEVTAAFEPVRVPSRPPDVQDTGWVVVVQEDPQQVKAEEPVESVSAVERIVNPPLKKAD